MILFGGPDPASGA